MTQSVGIKVHSLLVRAPSTMKYLVAIINFLIEKVQAVYVMLCKRGQPRVCTLILHPVLQLGFH